MKLRILIALVLLVQCASAQLIYETVSVDYDSAWQHRSLQLIPVRPKGPGQPGGGMISLSRAMRQGIATVSERGTASTENVHWLRVNNNSDKTIFVGSGETFSGGRQDRMVTKDTLLAPTGKDQYISVMCIEEGRWSEKEKKILYNNYANPELRKVLDRSKNQVLVWKEVLSQLDSAHFNSPTFAYNALKQNKELHLKEEEYLKYFLDKFKHSDSVITGFVCVSGNKVIGCDIFKDRDMFYDQLEPLLAGYISEAVLRGSEPMLSKEEIKLYMDQVLTNETIQDEFCKKNGKVFRANNRVIHVTSY
jgi:hypothetical protein